jgi:hypothetical protein
MQTPNFDRFLAPKKIDFSAKMSLAIVGSPTIVPLSMSTVLGVLEHWSTGSGTTCAILV